MTNITLFDDKETRDNLLPITLTRPVAAIRTGILTIAEKWEQMLDNKSGKVSIHYKTEEYLSTKFPAAPAQAVSLFIAGHLFPTRSLADAITALEPGHALLSGEKVIAFSGTEADFDARNFTATIQIEPGTLDGIFMLWDIFMKNGKEIENDFDATVNIADSSRLSSSCTLIGPEERLFIHPSAKVEGAILNTSAGPIYIGQDAEVMEGSCLRGPIAIGRHSTVNMGTKIYPATTIGPWCKVGGELNNVVMIGYSNKSHDGFLGNAVIGEWCNLGAGCVASNLKNDYTKIKLWNYPAHRFLKTDLQFCGLIMGDHSKAGINTMFNTATVVGVGVNIHGTGFPRNFIPSFSEGSTAGFSDVSMTKFFQIASRVMERRGITLTADDEAVFYAIRDFADNYK